MGFTFREPEWSKSRQFKLTAAFQTLTVHGFVTWLERFSEEGFSGASRRAPVGSRWDQGLINRRRNKRCRGVKAGDVCKGRFYGMDPRDDRLRQPVFLGIREDQEPGADVVQGKGELKTAQSGIAKPGHAQAIKGAGSNGDKPLRFKRRHG